MSALGLSAEALSERKLRIHAGDAAALMEGRWRQVYREKKGLVPDEDLSGELRVQLGSFTEPFNLWWCERATGRRIDYYTENAIAGNVWLGLATPAPGHLRELLDRKPRTPELQISSEYPFMAANLDGMTTTPQGHPCTIDAKHVGKFGEAELLRYTPAMTHQATVMGVEWWALSVLVGNSKHEVVYQAVDPLYQARLIATEREFFGYLERGEEPEDRTEPALPPKPQPKLRQILLDITPDAEKPNWSQEFIRLARQFAETKPAADLHAITRREMDALVPEDVGLCKVGLVSAKRDGRGFSVTLDKQGKNDG